MKDTYLLVKTNIGFVVFRHNSVLEVFPTPYGLVRFIMAHSDGNYIIFPCRDMARVIEFLYIMEHFLSDVSAKIASPQLLSIVMPEPLNPDKTVRCVFDANVHPALGGPRELTHDDLIYAVANLSMASRPHLDVFPILQEHSFWIPANWYNVADVEALARFMAYIGDPRWFLEDSAGSSRYRNLYRLLGLHDKRKFRRCFAKKLVMNPPMYAFRSWFSYAALQRVVDGDRDFTEQPGSFLLEKLYNACRTGSEHFLAALFKLTKEFVAVFCEVWAHFLTHRAPEDLKYLPMDLGRFSGFYQEYVGSLFPKVLERHAD